MPDTTSSSPAPATSARSRGASKKADASGKPGDTASKSPALARESTRAALPPKKRASKKKVDAFEAPAEAEWHRMISEAAYYRSESRGFTAGYADEDWTWAEEQVRKSLAP